MTEKKKTYQNLDEKDFPLSFTVYIGDREYSSVSLEDIMILLEISESEYRSAFASLSSDDRVVLACSLKEFLETAAAQNYELDLSPLQISRIEELLKNYGGKALTPQEYFMDFYRRMAFEAQITAKNYSIILTPQFGELFTNLTDLNLTRYIRYTNNEKFFSLRKKLISFRIEAIEYFMTTEMDIGSENFNFWVENVLGNAPYSSQMTKMLSACHRYMEKYAYRLSRKNSNIIKGIEMIPKLVAYSSGEMIADLAHEFSDYLEPEKVAAILDGTIAWEPTTYFYRDEKLALTTIGHNDGKISHIKVDGSIGLQNTKQTASHESIHEMANDPIGFLTV